MGAIFIVLFLFVSGTAWSQENPGVIDDQPKAVEQKNADKRLDSMRQYVETQTKKQQELKLLSLDLEKTKVEVERRKLLQELSKLSGAADVVSNSNAQPDTVAVSAVSAYFLKNIFIKGNVKEAGLDADGVLYVIKEGDTLKNWVVKSIDPQTMVLESANGEQRTVRLRK